MAYKLILELKQQTPMIHFQYGESGAVLRGTEIKPKLDKFLKRKAELKKEWFKKDTEALDYKIRVRAYGEKTVSDTINPMYFGNIGLKPEDPEYKRTVFYEGDIKVTILCFFPELYEIIKNNIREFFLTHNFGTRQSKGFGGFTVEKINNEACNNSPDAIVLLLKDYRYFYGRSPKGSGHHTMLNHALAVYAILKGGINDTRWSDKDGRYNKPERYIKSYIQRAFLDENTGSEKSYIKSMMPISNRAVLTSERKENDSKDIEYKKYVFIRAILGLADNFEYRNLRSGKVNVYNLGENGLSIKRFKSPITVKIINDNIFFLFDGESLTHITGKTFYLLENEPKWLAKKDYAEKKKYIMENGWEIHTPESIDIDKLISGFVKYFNEKRSILSNFRETDINGRLKSDNYSNSASLELKVGGDQNG